MAAQNQQQTPQRWYQDPNAIYRGLAKSLWISAFTTWFMNLAGRAVEIVLYATVLYSCAQLYPHIHLPDSLNLTVFLVQMGALDVGGLALSRMARQAAEEENMAGATNARRLSIGLIAIMLVGVAIVGIEQVISVDSHVQTGIRKPDENQGPSPDELSELSQELSEQFSQELTLAFSQLRQELSQQAFELSQMFSNQLRELSQQFTRSLETQGGQVAAIQDASATREQALSELAALPGMIERHEHATRQALAGMRASLESSAASKPKLSLVAGQRTTEKLTPDEGELTNRKFIEDYLSKHPEARNVDVIEAGSKLGLTISQSQASQIRKALKEQSA
jgi:hypothetical protein